VQLLWPGVLSCFALIVILTIVLRNADCRDLPIDVQKENDMTRTSITFPELGLIAGTRAMFGAGVGLLLADRLDPAQRRSVGWTLLIVGALTTIPLAGQVLLGRTPSNGHHPAEKPMPQREYTGSSI
jgi:hypothetical protein